MSGDSDSGRVVACGPSGACAKSVTPSSSLACRSAPQSSNTAAALWAALRAAQCRGVRPRIPRADVRPTVQQRYHRGAVAPHRSRVQRPRAVDRRRVQVRPPLAQQSLEVDWGIAGRSRDEREKLPSGPSPRVPADQTLIQPATNASRRCRSRGCRREWTEGGTATVRPAPCCALSRMAMSSADPGSSTLRRRSARCPARRTGFATRMSSTSLTSTRSPGRSNSCSTAPFRIWTSGHLRNGSALRAVLGHRGSHVVRRQRAP